MTARLIMKLAVRDSRPSTPDVLRIELVHPNRPSLPAWTAGSHVDVRLPDGRVRQYSLCGDPEDTSHYLLAVKREEAGRGGSAWLHDHASPGAIVHVSAPRNGFPLVEEAGRHVLVAGGIGITPILAMARSLSAKGRDFEVHYCVRSERLAPMLPELMDVCGDRLTVWSSLAERRFAPEVLGYPDATTHLYACGPNALTMSLETTLAAAGWPVGRVHVEAFQLTADENFKPEPFEATLASSGRTVTVRADQSLLEVLRGEGLVLSSSCESGLCGACECGYCSGTVIHRDRSLPVSRRQDRMLPCVSRGRGPIVLDL